MGLSDVGWSDGELLEMLDLSVRQKKAGAEIAEILSRQFLTGRNRSSVCGAIFRMKADNFAVPDICTVPEHCDGGMPVRWWEAGLAKQAALAVKPVVPTQPIMVARSMPAQGGQAQAQGRAGGFEAHLRGALGWAVRHNAFAGQRVESTDALAFHRNCLRRAASDRGQYMRVRFRKADLEIFWLDEHGNGGPILVRLPARHQPAQMPTLKAAMPPEVAAQKPVVVAPPRRVLHAPVIVNPRADLVDGIAHPAWSPGQDMAILQAKAAGTPIADLAGTLGRPMLALNARWHRLRVLPGLEAELAAFIKTRGDRYCAASQGVQA